MRMYDEYTNQYYDEDIGRYLFGCAVMLMLFVAMIIFFVAML